MRLVEYPQHYEPDGSPSIYLAGSGTSRPGWQASAVALLDAAGFTGAVLNPQPCDPATGPSGAWTSSGWQEHNLRRNGVVLLWCPLGAQQIRDVHLSRHSRTALVVGCDRGDPAQRAVHAELLALMPRLSIVTDLAATVRAALAHFNAPAATRP
ncbi:nucleoside 2-deoxyribosyltransferase domain-containing protein [Kitasatospora aureofaciens]|uniref:nucleoside 2-deoxyribosyltransferase domain-containing protein n=1 Tax=Kitasatospora aureofaciens TaxID=1894 RepID=UPI001C459016|nr:nucleoside 2-deoxyribosyltransferase domain-containing protein [Kitasatospora aureofaciens]MBV6695680.1 nucleoside 2-deoxyribosyltransferase domain-containing protein [Kitasatospora aureofaciens]